MRITSFFIASAFICTAPAASADIIEFSYQGQDFICTNLKDICGDYGLTIRGWQGSVTIDSDLYPLESVAGTTLRISYDFDERDTAPYFYSVFSTTVSNEFLTDERIIERFFGGPGYDGPDAQTAWVTDPQFAFLEIDPFFERTLYPLVGPSPSFIEITINDDLSVTDWRFDSGLQGGSGDYRSGKYGDSYSDGYQTLGPGSWSVLVNGAPPVSPVPLPASALLLLAGLGGLVAFRKRGSSA